MIAELIILIRRIRAAANGGGGQCRNGAVHGCGFPLGQGTPVHVGRGMGLSTAQSCRAGAAPASVCSRASGMSLVQVMAPGLLPSPLNCCYCSATSLGLPAGVSPVPASQAPLSPRRAAPSLLNHF